MRSGVLRVGLAAALWGSWALFLRPSGVSPWISAPVIFLIMGALSLPLVALDRRRPTWDRTTAGLLALNGTLAACNVVTYFGAIDQTTLAVAVLTHYAAPLLVAIAAPFVDGERACGAGTAALLGLVGLVLVLEPWATGAGRGNLVAGAALGGASAVFYAGSVFVARRLEPRIGAARTIAYHALVAGALLAPIAVTGLGELDARAVGLLALGAAIPGAIAGVLFVTGLARIGSARAAVLAYLEPVVAVIVGWLVWRERLGPLAVAGAAAIIGAGVLVNRRR